MLRPRDFIETVEGLFFAVVSYHHPPESCTSFLSYRSSKRGSRVRNAVRLEKVASTEASFRYLRDNFPEYVFKAGNIAVQGVPRERIARVYSPTKKLEEIYRGSSSAIEAKVLKVSEAFPGISKHEKGVTGSVLIGLENEASDIDFVFYGLKTHERARESLGELLGTGDIRTLGRREWKRVYKKRFPGHRTLSFEDFLWHEKRKCTRAVIGGTIFDMLLVRKFDEIGKKNTEEFKRLGKVKVKCIVTDSTLAFDSPAVYKVEGAGNIAEVVSFTHTYAGQAFGGEEVEVSGVLEKCWENHRVIVGTTREARGEYIKVLP